ALIPSTSANNFFSPKAANRGNFFFRRILNELEPTSLFFHAFLIDFFNNFSVHIRLSAISLKLLFACKKSKLLIYNFSSFFMTIYLTQSPQSTFGTGPAAITYFLILLYKSP